MDESDEYDFDDIVLDDQTLAILDQEEQKYKLQSENPHSGPSTVTAEPPAKRLKTSNGWTAGSGSRSNVPQADDDLPEISLQGDGSYAISNQVNQPVPKYIPQQQKLQRNVRAGDIHRVPNVAASRHISTPQAGTSHMSYHGNPRQNPMQNTRPQPQQPMPQANVQSSAQLQAQMAELQKKLDELRGENTKMQSTLKNALEAKFAKEGEVSILRKSIEKTAQNHATQMTLFKADKEKAEARQAQMQKEMKDEMERLRTQFVFRQQELESSARKPPASVRAKKIGRDFPSTPLAVPAAMSGWHASGFEPTSPRRQSHETPVRNPRLPPAFKVSPSKPPRNSPGKSRKVPSLPGFQNAFETSTPMRSPSNRVEKGKGKMAPASNVFGPEPSLSFRPLQQISQGHTLPPMGSVASHTQQPDIFLAPASRTHTVSESSQLNDEDMDVVPPESDEDLLAEELEVFEGINWKAELCRIILTHSNSSEGQIIFQQLINSSQFVNSTNIYSNSCARILAVVGSSMRSEDYHGSIRVVSESLLCLLAELGETNQLLTMAILFSLLSTLVLSLPDFQSAFLLARISLEGDKRTSGIEIISNLIVKHLEPTKNHLQRDEFATEILTLLEALCFREPQAIGAEIEAIASNRDVLMILLHASQPTWLLERSTRLLVLLSTHHSLYKALLKIRSAATDQDALNDDHMKDPFIELLCSHLTDASKLPTENTKVYILTYLAQISIAHCDVHTILRASYTLMPSLIIYISHLTTPLWEDDGSLAASAETTSFLIQVLNQTMFLLYHLIFGMEPSLNLGHKLQTAPHRQFNSISHIFIVTFGRLSYCDAPSWIDTDRQHDLEYLAEVSSKIFEAVFDGLEGDTVWGTFQVGEEEAAIDEEEMEAQLIGVEL